MLYWNDGTPCKRLYLAYLSGAALTTVLLLTANVGNAQNRITDGGWVEPHNASLDFITPASFESANALDEFASGDSCVDCGNSHADCSCGGLLHHRACCWDGSMELGLNGAAGNSENINLVFGFDAKRESGCNAVSTDLDYFYKSEDEAVSENRLYWLTRYERAIADSAWSWIGDSWVEYDEFEDFDVRIGLHAGAGVLLYDTIRTEFKGRIGLGTSRKFGTLDDQWKPEAYLGGDYEWRLNDRHKITITSTYYSDVGDVGSFRWNTKASWQCMIDEEHNLALKLSAFDRWDSTPSLGEQPNDIDYWCSLLWGF